MITYNIHQRVMITYNIHQICSMCQQETNMLQKSNVCLAKHHAEHLTSVDGATDTSFAVSLPVIFNNNAVAPLPVTQLANASIAVDKQYMAKVQTLLHILA